MISRTSIGACAVAATAVLLAGCSSSTNSGTATPGQSSSSAATSAASTPTATVSLPPATVSVSGTWSGQYSGPFNGTFTLQWTQSGSDVNGTIQLSSPADNLNINGTLSGSAISFGAVGVVTYSGTVSGNTMSGTYTDVANGQQGTWSANKSG